MSACDLGLDVTDFGMNFGKRKGLTNRTSAERVDEEISGDWIRSGGASDDTAPEKEEQDAE